MALPTNTKRSQVLQITPAHEIVLKGPFDRVVTSYLELYNPTDEQICFKVKTTAPRRYCVRPNSGLIKPTEKIKIAIMLQPIDNDSQSERNRHKFMVQSVSIKDENMNVDNIWNEAPSNDIMDSKLRCVFQMPSVSEDSETSASPSSTTASAPAPPSYPQATTQSPSSKSKSKVQDEPNIQESSYASRNFSELSQQSIDGRQMKTNTILPRDETILFVMMLLVGIVGIILGKYII